MPLFSPPHLRFLVRRESSRKEWTSSENKLAKKPTLKFVLSSVQGGNTPFPEQDLVRVVHWMSKIFLAQARRFRKSEVMLIVLQYGHSSPSHLPTMCQIPTTKWKMQSILTVTNSTNKSKGNSEWDSDIILVLPQRGQKKSAHPGWGESFHRKVSSIQSSTAGRALQMLTMLEVKLQPWISRKITRMFLALLRANLNSKPTPSAAFRNTASSSETSKGEFSWFCPVPGWKTCENIKQQQRNPWPRWQKNYKTTEVSRAPLPQ